MWIGIADDDEGGGGVCCESDWDFYHAQAQFMWASKVRIFALFGFVWN